MSKIVRNSSLLLMIVGLSFSFNPMANAQEGPGNPIPDEGVNCRCKKRFLAKNLCKAAVDGATTAVCAPGDECWVYNANC